ncbi:MAG: betaine/proline/choline family ABC transporter ATP-binding protein [Streptosporangiales bacterium]|nr:betaine/proline/choline family ABC transporter ATP-binding protein [Streptosporangiales bacterium]
MAEQPMIRLDRVSKSYPGQSAPAVAELSLEVRSGEIVVLLGPSGCGKTTTMRMINRLIEPTSGRVFVDGEDVTHVDADQLRRRIGYVIQQVGLLPHMTVGANIAMVPKALGWDRKRIEARVNELLTLLGLDPDDYRDRYPKQLSGGQQQRVGVARALAADPPVMLMDEPFGALDPIIRDRLQDEFLALQKTINKTIVFVTHDIEEALKLGDRIAIFGEHGRIAQFDTPARLLTHPADDFVASFIGTGGAVRLLALQRVADLPCDPDADADADPGDAPVVHDGQTLYEAVDIMLAAQRDDAVVMAADGRVRGRLSFDIVLRRAGAGAASDAESAG